MSRFERMLEIMMVLNDRQKRTVAELADQFGVSRRTMLRDLQTLSEIGVPLAAAPGPGGGYQLARSAKLPPVQFTPEEALGLIISCEAFFQLEEGPFRQTAVSTVTKIKAVLSPELLTKVQRMTERISAIIPKRAVTYPFLDKILEASESGRVLTILYASRARTIRRDIAPFGLYLADGLWYAVCYCYLRERFVTLRVDRILAVDDSERQGIFRLSLTEALEKTEDDNGESVRCTVRLTKKGCKLADPDPYFGDKIRSLKDGSGIFEDDVSTENLDWYARFFLSLGEEATVEEPKALADLIGQKAVAIAEKYA
ncbi:helix-turn-helix transcriptional regulator [Camelliibacillus cellulosilyticus]|uniref:Helix-turn-helix transcriptional regulator n=1 Tax=Camelliibacillus cellulosilyticus TaxID=2174486 RepID=A0ABV9GRN3_9BACL